MTSEIFIVPSRARYFLKRQDGTVVMNKYGYKDKHRAKAALWYYINGINALKRAYELRGEINNRHLKSIL